MVYCAALMTAQPDLVQLDTIQKAHRRLKGRLHRTPTVCSASLSRMTELDLHFKLEMFQKTGSFKVRGVLNKLDHLSLEEKARGVIALSAGNHGQALAWAGRREGIASTIVMPATAVASKIEATRNYGGEVILTHGSLLKTCLSLSRERNLTLVHHFDDPLVVAGQGGVGLEILEDLPDVDVVVVGCGGGGLISGVAAAINGLRPSVRVIGVEPGGALTMTRSLEKGAPVDLKDLHTIADGLAAPFVGALNLRHVQDCVEQVVAVEDGEIMSALRLILERLKVVAEPAAAATLAAVLCGRFQVAPGARVVCVLSGGNLDLDRLPHMRDE